LVAQKKKGEVFVTAFFPTYKDNWTRTPNVFFDEILRNPKANLNQVRLVGYLIRQTIGYNQDAKWACVSRSDLIKKAGIPNSRIKKAIQDCERNNWILTYEDGTGTKKKRYIFLNDDRNQRIVIGLKKGLFSIKDLEYLNLAGIDKLLSKYQITTTTETGEATTTETGEATTTETGEATTTETGEADIAQSQESQGFEQSLNTIYKDNNKYNNNKDDVVVEKKEKKWKKHSARDVRILRKKIQEFYRQDISLKTAEELISLSDQKGNHISEYFQSMILRFNHKNETPWNPVGALKHQIINDWIIRPPKDQKRKTFECTDPMAQELRSDLYKEYSQKGLIPNEN